MSDVLAFTTASTITVSVVGFFAFLVLVVLARAVMRRDDPAYRRYRMGIFVERDDGGVGTRPDEREHRPPGDSFK